MQCDYFDAGVCRSCAWMGRPYAEQLRDKHEYARSVLAGGEHPEPSELSGPEGSGQERSGHGRPGQGAPDLEWEKPVASPSEAFRNKAKMVVGGTAEEPTLGILDPRGRGVDLRGCGLHEPRLRSALPALAELIGRARLTPYDVATRRGELKHVLTTVSPDGALMVRWVLRSTEAVPRIRKQLPWLENRLPTLQVASVNLQPEPKAVLEGAEELVLSTQVSLPMRLAGLDLRLRPQGFFQTNTAVAAALYEQAGLWIREVAPRTAVDLFCGVGGFALTAARSGVPHVLGVEQSEEAVLGARERAPHGVRFVVGDAMTFAVGAGGRAAPDLVVVNPPRRGIGDELAAHLDESSVGHVLYSSCSVDSLARDLDAMPSLSPVRARLFDMFPQTTHHEVLVLLRRRRG